MTPVAFGDFSRENRQGKFFEISVKVNREPTLFRKKYHDTISIPASPQPEANYDMFLFQNVVIFKTLQLKKPVKIDTETREIRILKNPIIAGHD